MCYEMHLVGINKFFSRFLTACETRKQIQPGVTDEEI